jgi:hypothetical protein
MNPVTTRRRGPHRVDARRRPGAAHGGGQLPTLFDSAQAATTARVDAGERSSSRARVDAGERSSPRARVDAGDRPSSLPVAAGSGETLDRLVVTSWERLASRADAPCLVCGGTMEPAYGTQAVPIGGRCRDCGTTLG